MASVSAISHGEYNHLMKDSVTMDANEGDVTIGQEEIDASGGEAKTATWATPIQKGYTLILDTTRNFTVKARPDDNSDPVIGFSLEKPANETARPKVPFASAVGTVKSGIFRSVGVEIQGDFIRTVDLKSGAAPTLGASIKQGTGAGNAHKWEVDATPNHTINVVIPSLAGGQAGRVSAIFGSYGRDY